MTNLEDTCPHCGTSQQGKEIPEADRQYYGYVTHGSRTIGIEVRGVYDGVLYWACPDCRGTWHRWPEGHYLHKRAAKYITVKETTP